MLRAIIIDDEPNCIETLGIMLERHCPEVEVLQTFTNPLEAPEAILQLSPDLLFLDIEMPGMTGFDLLEKVKSMAEPAVIFTTAHNEYANKAFKYAAIDYLLKPVDAFDLKAAVERFKVARLKKDAGHRMEVLMANHNRVNPSPILSFAMQDCYEFVNVDDIIRCEADGAYTKFFVAGGEMFIVSRTMGYYEDILTENNFFRVHDKHIVNKYFIKKYIKEDGQILLTDGTLVDVSRRRKDGFLKWMGA